MAILLTGSMSSQTIWQFIKLILIFVVILILAYYATRFVAKYHSNSLVGKTGLKIVESMSVGNNKFIVIAQINGSYYALGVGKDEITFIDKLSDYTPRVSEGMTVDDGSKKSFKDVLAQLSSKSGQRSGEDNRSDDS
ncbi:MAG: flagellar biosynthetic protein FliO [Clostridium sp.]|nr:flagellar biosynthetic protein FliO [Clostridium sp.]MCM1397995.1 flagellar biosynthetic protein FliO [Clostridium sp.]MCM1459369.1 flagellar biosynthetic protein FliO [Bacteroides sp.]